MSQSTNFTFTDSVYLHQFVVIVYSSTSQVGRRLAEIGDQINDRYEGEFRSMIQQLHITPSTAYQAFAGVARK